MKKLLFILLCFTSIFIGTSAFARFADRIAMDCYFFYLKEESDHMNMNADEIREWDKGNLKGLYNMYLFTLFLQDKNKKEGLCMVEDPEGQKEILVSRSGNTLFYKKLYNRKK